MCVAVQGRGSPVKVTHSLIRHISGLLATKELQSPFSNQSKGCHTKGELPNALPIPLNSLSQMNLNSAVRKKTHRIQEEFIFNFLSEYYTSAIKCMNKNELN